MIATNGSSGQVENSFARFRFVIGFSIEAEGNTPQAKGGEGQRSCKHQRVSPAVHLIGNVVLKMSI
jgi:hypothetical protein